MQVLPENSYLDSVRRYWRDSHSAYLESVGTTFQAGLIYSDDGEKSATRSNLNLAAAAGIRAGQSVLDAGCGVCGPSIDIARHVQGLNIVALTLSPEQASTASNLVRKHDLSGVIRIAIADYHQIPAADSSFDVVCFFESAGYSYDPDRLFREVRRVTRPGGTIYVKDMFRKEDPLSQDELAELAEFDRTFSQRTPTMSQFKDAFLAAGLTDIRCRDLTDLVSTDHILPAMFKLSNGYLEPTRFGELHFRSYQCLPTYFGEIRAVRPKE